MKKTLFCWSGGGLPGLDIHCGIWKALEEAKIHATANAGTSAGAIVAAFNSCSSHSVHSVESLLRSLTDGDVRSARFLWKLRMFFISHFLRNGPIKKLLARTLPVSFGALAKPLTVFVTQERFAKSVAISQGDLHTAILASMSISGVFPPVWDKGERYSDGGSTASLPLPFDLATYDDIYLLIAKRPVDYIGKDTILTRMMFNVDMLIEDQINDTIWFAKTHHTDVHVIRPACRAPRGSLHFDHHLIDEAYLFTQQIIARDRAGRKTP